MKSKTVKSVSFANFPVYSPCRFNGELTHAKLEDVFMFTVFFTDGTRKKFYIPDGFVWDGNSIPLLFAFTGTPWEMKILIAGLVHDWLYKHQHLNRAQADRVHYLFGRLCGKGWWSMSKMYRVLRIAGWRAWNHNKAIYV